MIVRKNRRTLQEIRKQLKEVWILLEEDLHNITLQAYATHHDKVVCKEEEYIAWGA